jgi:hypothetical protein
MKIYFSGGPGLKGKDYLNLMRGQRILFSFLERKRRVYQDLALFREVVLDSGAYSVATGRAKVDLYEYADFCHQIKGRVGWYANLDVIGDYKASESNLRKLEALRLRPLPVFHSGEPWELLRDLQREFPLVGLGFELGVKAAEKWAWLDYIFHPPEESGLNPLHKFHGFKMTARKILARFPFHSVDSSTWMLGAANGWVPTDTGQSNQFHYLSRLKKCELWLEFFDSLAEGTS